MQASLDGVVEHPCFCAIDPVRRVIYRSKVRSRLKPGGSLSKRGDEGLGVWCPPLTTGSDHHQEMAGRSTHSKPMDTLENNPNPTTAKTRIT